MRLRVIPLVALVVATVPALAFAAAGSVGGPAVVAKMSGKVEVPPGDPNGKGNATIHLNTKTGRVCWSFTYKNIDKPTAAHIHEAAKGKSGPVVVPLGTKFARKGCTKAAKGEVKEILKKPAKYYVNIHTAKYPNGAIRGQLRRAAKS
jgi:CHRD domain